MFFTDEEMLVAEDLAWKMLDGWNHSYMPNLEKYAHFYYNGQVVLDPWMNEKCQDLTWPDHKDKKVAVCPISYYGQKTIEDYVVNLFLLRPEWNPEITKKIRKNLDEQGRLRRTTTIMPVEVFIAMSDGQAQDEHGSVCIEWELPESDRIYFDMVKLPEKYVRIVKNGWEKEVVFSKDNAAEVINFLYPNGAKFDFEKRLGRIYGNEVRLIGYGD